MRVTLDRDGPLYKGIYKQRTSTERGNSQSKAAGVERAIRAQHPLGAQSQYAHLPGHQCTRLTAGTSAQCLLIHHDARQGALASQKPQGKRGDSHAPLWQQRRINLPCSEPWRHWAPSLETIFATITAQRAHTLLLPDGYQWQKRQNGQSSQMLQRHCQFNWQNTSDPRYGHDCEPPSVSIGALLANPSKR